MPQPPVATIPEPTLTLLHAVLTRGDAAVASFQSWQKGADLENLSAQEYNLLPLLYHNLEPLGVDHPWMGRLQGIQRRTWYANQVALRTVEKITHDFFADDIPSLIIGGIALASTVYGDLALRPTPIPQIGVRSYEALAAMHGLGVTGWRPDPPNPHLKDGDYRRWFHGCIFVNDQKQHLGLNWTVLGRRAEAGLDEIFWQDAIPLSAGPFPSRTLCPTDHLLWASLSHESAGPIALVDGVMLLEKCAMEWDRLVELAELFQVADEVVRFLELLAYLPGVSVPEEIGPELQRIAQTPQPGPRRPPLPSAHTMSRRQRFQRHFMLFSMGMEESKTRPGPARFLRYLQLRWGTKGLWETLLLGMRKFFRPSP